ncbi:hypothetical protein T265_05378 [Opisthorchis viverrini]|uniref:Uncharacterized protein n=1 Tax=Opisthorchis viverrini TaxID=6198 RepID=A0A074ZWF5_OPIVI|nr:hypothetical protein T265_05378 [Opisthorchis viverrini]KER27660.1 hypothetical protein T265_05378 [Opisthorchis viverrini]
MIPVLGRSPGSLDVTSPDPWTQNTVDEVLDSDTPFWSGCPIMGERARFQLPSFRLTIIFMLWVAARESSSVLSRNVLTGNFYKKLNMCFRITPVSTGAEISAEYLHPAADISALFPQISAPGCGTSAEMKQVSAPSPHPIAEISAQYLRPSASGADISAQYPHISAAGCRFCAEMKQIFPPSHYPDAEIVQKFPHPGAENPYSVPEFLPPVRT